MRYTLAALIGLIALGGVQARALPGISNDPGIRAPEFDLTHISDDPLDELRNNWLTKRFAAGVTPPRPSLPKAPSNHPVGNGGSANRLRQGRPNAEEEPDGVAMAIERADLSQTSDIVKIKPCAAAKRGLEELEFNTPVEKRMSGEEQALTWEEWQQVFREVDQQLGLEDNVKLTKKFKIIFMGGISGIAFGSRGEGGKTGDADFSFHVDTPEDFRKAMRNAVDRMVTKNPGKFEVIARIGKPDPMNDEWDKLATADSKAHLSQNSQVEAWAGNYFTAFHGDWRMQLISKMDRIAKWRARTGEFKQKDQQDAKFFLQKVKESIGNRELTMEDFVLWGKMIGQDPDQTKALTKVSMKIVVGDNMAGIAQDIKDGVNAMKC